MLKSGRIRSQVCGNFSCQRHQVDQVKALSEWKTFIREHYDEVYNGKHSDTISKLAEMYREEMHKGIHFDKRLNAWGVCFRYKGREFMKQAHTRQRK